MLYFPRLVAALILAHLALFCAGAAFAEEPGAKLPADAQSLLNAEALKESLLKSKYEADLAALRKELVPKLQRAQDAATRKGDLDGAMAIKAKVAELDPKGSAAGVVADAPLTVVKAAYGLDSRSGKDVLDAVVGWLKNDDHRKVCNESFGFDPAPNARKQLFITVRDNRNGAQYTKVLDEGDLITYDKLAR